MSKDETWNLCPLRDKILAEKPENYLFLADCINSLGRTVSIFRYHAFLAKETSGKLISPEKSSDENMIQFMFPQNEDWLHRELKLIELEANVIAAIHIVRNSYDIFAQIVNGTLLAPPLPIHECNFHKVVKRMSSSRLYDLLVTLQRDEWFMYIEAFSNVTKHRLIPTRVSRVTLDQPRLGMFIDGFNYRHTDFQGKWADDILEGAVSVKNQIVACGIALNEIY